MVVAGKHQDAAMLARTCGIGVLENIAATVDARPLAIPHGEHAVVIGGGKKIELLRAPN